MGLPITSLAANVNENGKKIAIYILVQGNFDYGTMENAQKVMDKFKAKFNEELAKAK
ncbi:MAG: hypothetical protein WCS77_10435 [Elusimicrobiaceae bacterium]